MNYNSVTTGLSQFLEVFTIFLHTWSMVEDTMPLFYCIVNDVLVTWSIGERAASAASVRQCYAEAPATDGLD